MSNPPYKAMSSAYTYTGSSGPPYQVTTSWSTRIYSLPTSFLPLHLCVCTHTHTHTHT